MQHPDSLAAARRLLGPPLRKRASFCRRAHARAHRAPVVAASRLPSFQSQTRTGNVAYFLVFREKPTPFRRFLRADSLPRGENGDVPLPSARRERTSGTCLAGGLHLASGTNPPQCLGDRVALTQVFVKTHGRGMRSCGNLLTIPRNAGAGSNPFSTQIDSLQKKRRGRF